MLKICSKKYSRLKKFPGALYMLPLAIAGLEHSLFQRHLFTFVASSYLFSYQTPPSTPSIIHAPYLHRSVEKARLMPDSPTLDHGSIRLE